MATYSKDKLKLITQGITGGKIWDYNDTGTVLDVAGFFANAGDMGVDSGDLIFSRGGGVTKVVRSAAFAPGYVQDTGATQGTTGPGTLVGDTG
jgi:hypothetical protein